MKKNIILFTFIVFLSCTSNSEIEIEIINYDCTPSKEVNGWQRIQFNHSHTISVPNDYRNYNEIQKNGIYFSQRKTGELVVFIGGSCASDRNPCYIEEYRDNKTIEDNASTAGYFNNNGEVVNFSNRILVCQDGIPVAYFFYEFDINPKFRDSYGEIYLKDPKDNKFKMAGYVQFAKSELEETFNIIKSFKFN